MVGPTVESPPVARTFARVFAVGLAATVLCGCGSRLEPPAAVVSGHVISQSELADAVRQALTDPTTAQDVAARGTAGRQALTSEVLSRLVDFELVRSYAASRGIRVTGQDVSAALAQIQAQNGGASAYRRLLTARGLTPAEVRAIIRDNILVQKVQQELVAGARSGATQSPQAIFDEWLKERAQAATIRVNPRFGAFDRSSGSIVPLDSTALLPG